jgi:hypothetical protein
MQKTMFNDKCFLTDLTLEGIKRMTRRPIKVKNIIVRDCDPIFNPADAYYKGHSGYYLLIDGDTGKVIRPRYKVGEIVAVAQSYYKAGIDPGMILGDGSNGFIFNEKGWENKMYVRPDLMPHRIKITGVRAEKLQDISDEDCLAEGIQFDGKAQSFYCGFNTSTGSKIWLGRNPRESFAALIDLTSGKGTWQSNPFVFVYEYKLIK